MIIISMNLMSIRRWRDSSSSSSSFCSWHTPWGKACLIDYSFIIIWQSHRHRQRPTINLVSPLESVSVMKPMDSRWPTTAWRSLGCRTENPAVLWEDEPCMCYKTQRLPASQTERWSLDGSAVYQYHHSTVLLNINKCNHGTFRSCKW